MDERFGDFVLRLNGDKPVTFHLGEHSFTVRRAAHVQKPAEIEHVADDVSKNGAESNMTAQPAAPQGVAYAELPDEHAAFETWARLRSDWRPNLERKGDGYVGAFADEAWRGWSARASHGQAPAADYDHGPQSLTVAEAARHVGKWLNERPNRPLDLRDVAMLCAHAQKAPAAGAVAGPTRAQIRDVFLANGFTVKEGQTDLKPYVYAAAEALLALVAAPTPAAQADGVLEDAATGMAAEYQRWIDFFHKGNGDYNDFLRIELNHDAARKQGGTQ